MHYHGEAIALVVAETFEQATSAARLVRFKPITEEGAYDIANGMKMAYPPASMVAGKADSKIGDFDKAFSEAAMKLDATYKTPYQSHNAMELVASIAEWSGDKVTIHGAFQLVASTHKAIAETLKIPLENVEIVSEFVGGGFGGKLPVHADAVLAALAARQLKRPVKVSLTRQQMFSVATHRCASIQRVRLAADQNGKLAAIAHEVFTQTARMDEYAEGAATCTRGLYAAPNRVTTHRVVPLDLPVADSMRAPGDATGLLALEQAMDELADRLGIDPIELRLRNEPEQDPEKHVPFSQRNLVSCLKQGAEQFGWTKRVAKPGQREGRHLAGRPRHVGGDPSQHPPAGRGARAAHGRRSPSHGRDGHDRHRHRYLYDHEPDRRRAGRRAGRQCHREARPQFLSGDAGLRRVVRRG